CSSCGALYTKSCACSKGGFIDKFVCDPNKTPYSSQRPPQDCPKCENPVDCLYCRHCALLRKKLKEQKFSKDFLNTSGSSNDDSNVVSMPQESIVFNQDPEKNPAQSPSQMDHQCCYGCGDSLDGIFCQRCTFISENSDAAIESFTPSHILVEDSDSLMEEIDLSLTLDDSMLSGIKNDDYDSEGDILILEEFLSNDSFSLPENESFHFDIPSSPRPLAKPSDDDEIEPNSGNLTIKVVGDISEHYVLMPKLLPTQPTLDSNKEKSPYLLSHRGLKAFQLSSKSPMMIYGGNIPILDVPFLYFYPP
nr:hypothetical protein [Tanacetum cinerariifolium]